MRHPQKNPHTSFYERKELFKMLWKSSWYHLFMVFKAVCVHAYMPVCDVDFNSQRELESLPAKTKAL